MDQASSSLDSTNDLFLQKAIQESSRYLKVISIAHRLRNILQNDIIFVFEHGVIIEKVFLWIYLNKKVNTMNYGIGKIINDKIFNNRLDSYE